MTSPEIFTNNMSFYEDPLAQDARNDLMTTQMANNLPQSSSSAWSIVSDPILPDRNVIDRLGHFDPDIYDLRDNSHLMKLLRAMLGGAGAGGLRKQIAIARLQNSFHTTHFLDLDRFYGALFGIVRTQAELMPDFGTMVDSIPANEIITYSVHDSTHYSNLGTTAPGQFCMGEEFEVSNPISLKALRYWRPALNVTAQLGAIFSVNTGTEIPGTRVGFANPPTSSLPAWHTSALPTEVTLEPGRYKVVISFTDYYYFLNYFFSTGAGSVELSSGSVKLLPKEGATGTAQGSYIASVDGSLKYPTGYDANGASWGLDIVYADVVTTTATNVGGQFDPYTDAAGSDIWDDIHSRDASYRSRLLKFARAIPQGGTYPGLLAACEAVLSVDCEMYESWSWIDEIGGASTVKTGYSYTAIERSFKNWDTLAKNRSWADLTGTTVTVGRLMQPNRSEVVLKPKRVLREDERFQLLRVLRKIAPVGVQFTIDPSGIALHEKQPIRNVAASSEYWEVMSKTVTQPGQSYQQPRPAFSQYTGEKWSYNNDVATISSYEMVGDTPLTSTDYDTVTYNDGTSHRYLPSDGLVPGKEAAVERVTADGVCTSKPYVPARNPSLSIFAGLRISIGDILNIRAKAGVVIRR